MNASSCSHCNNPISKERQKRGARYCSDECSKTAAHGKYVNATDSPRRTDIPTSTTGAIHELLVCIDLMRKGCHVFRSQSPSCPCDIIAMVDGRVYKVEVTTGQETIKGFSYPKKSARYDYDIIAVVIRNKDIVYIQNGTEVMPPKISGIISQKPNPAFGDDNPRHAL